MFEELRENGKQLFTDGKFKEAIKLYKEYIRKNRESTEKKQLGLIYCNISTCYSKLDKHENALKFATLAINQDPYNEKALYRRALSHESLGDYENSMKDLQTLIRINPDNTYNKKAAEVMEKYNEEVARRSNTSEIFKDLLDKFQAEQDEKMKSSLISHAHYLHKNKYIVCKTTVESLINMINSNICPECLYKILIIISKDVYENCLVIDQILTKLPFNPSQSSNVTDEIIELLSNHIETYVARFTAENPPPLHSDAFAARKSYNEKIMLYLSNHQYIPNFIQAIIEWVKTPETHSLRLISVMYKLLNINKHLTIFCLHNDILDGLVTFNIPRCFEDEAYWQNYDENLKISSLVSGCLQSIYTAASFNKEDTETYYAKIALSLNDAFNKGLIFKFIFMFFYFVHLEIDIPTHLLVEDSNSWGLKLFENVHTTLFPSIKEFFSSHNENVLAFFTDYIINLLNCTKLKIDENLKSVLFSIFDCAYKHSSCKIQLLSLLAFAKYHLKDQDTSFSFSEYYSRAKRIILQSKIDFQSVKAIEVFSFLTLNADIKEVLINDSELMARLFEITDRICELIKKSKTDADCIENAQYIPGLFCFLSVLANLASIHHHQQIKDPNDDLSESKKELKKLALKTGQPLNKKHPKDKKTFVNARLSKLSTPKFFSTLYMIVNCLKSSPDHIFFDKISLSKHSPYYAACLYYKTLDNYDIRGMAAQNGAVKGLISLCGNLKLDSVPPTSGPAYLETPYIAANALALIAIAINPSVCFTSQTIIDALQPLFCNCDFHFNNKRQFESLLALTNIASYSDDVRNYIARLPKAFHAIETAIFDENPLLKRAAVELTTNLLLSYEFVDKYYSPEKFVFNGEERDVGTNEKVERIKIIILLAGETEDKQLSSAAAGSLAILTHYPIICDYITTIEVFIEIINELLVSQNADLVYRSLYILSNLLKHDGNYKEVIRSKFLESLNSLKDCMDAVELQKSKYFYQEILKALD